MGKTLSISPTTTDLLQLKQRDTGLARQYENSVLPELYNVKQGTNGLISWWAYEDVHPHCGLDCTVHSLPITAWLAQW